VASATHAQPIYTTTQLTTAERAAVIAMMRECGIRRAHLLLGVARHAMERASGGPDAGPQRSSAQLWPTHPCTRGARRDEH
jgi:hypothetical protein